MFSTLAALLLLSLPTVAQGPPPPDPPGPGAALTAKTNCQNAQTYANYVMGNVNDPERILTYLCMTAAGTAPETWNQPNPPGFVAAWDAAYDLFDIAEPEWDSLTGPASNYAFGETQYALGVTALGNSDWPLAVAYFESGIANFNTSAAAMDANADQWEAAKIAFNSAYNMWEAYYGAP